MIGTRVKTEFHARRLRDRARAGNVMSLQHAAAAIRLTAKRSIRRKKGPAPRGQPPHTHKGTLPRSILYAVDKLAQTAIIGTSHRIINVAGGEHEIQFSRRKRLPQRPFMAPALQKMAPRLPKHWASSISG